MMALWPFRNMILAAPRRAAKAAAAAAERDSSAAVSPTQQAAAAAGDNAAAAEAGAAAIQAGGSQSSARSGGRNSSGSSEGHRASGAAQPESSDPGGGSGGGSSNDGSEPAAALLTAGDPPVLRDRRPRHLHSEYLFYFGDAYDLCAALHISNRLTGWALGQSFLILCAEDMHLAMCSACVARCTLAAVSPATAVSIPSEAKFEAAQQVRSIHGARVQSVPPGHIPTQHIRSTCHVCICISYSIF